MSETICYKVVSRYYGDNNRTHDEGHYNQKDDAMSRVREVQSRMGTLQSGYPIMWNSGPRELSWVSEPYIGAVWLEIVEIN